MQCPGWCWDGGDGRTGPMATEVTNPAGLTSRCSPVRGGVVVRPPFEGSVVLFRGRGVSAVREWAAQCYGLTPAMPHSAAQWRGWPHRGVGGTALGRDSQVRHGVDSSLTWAPANVSALNAPVRGAGMEAAGP
jgi:hypothetical protein